MAHKLSERENTKIIHTNWGYWDGVADRQKARMAKWYRSTAKNFGHFDADYAKGYDLGIWGQDPPPYAMGTYTIARVQLGGQ